MHFVDLKIPICEKIEKITGLLIKIMYLFSSFTFFFIRLRICAKCFFSSSSSDFRKKIRVGLLKFFVVQFLKCLRKLETSKNRRIFRLQKTGQKVCLYFLRFKAEARFSSLLCSLQTIGKIGSASNSFSSKNFLEKRTFFRESLIT